MITKKKIKTWFNRYFLAEFTALLVTIFFTFLTFKLTNNYLISAFVGSVLSNLGFYGIIIYKEFQDKSYSGSILRRLILKIRNLIFEFGPPEILDTFFIRIYFLYLIPQYISNYSIAIIIGDLLASFVFYLLAIILYEIRKKYFKN